MLKSFVRTNITFFLSSFAVLLISNIHAQFGFEFDPTIPVVKNGNDLTNPWGGGLNYTQVSDFDFDFDGDMDLFLFDRSSNNIRVLEQKDNAGTPYYETNFIAKYLFPTDVRYRACMVDYNNDGKNDLFTYGIGGLKVYKNTGSLATGLTWELSSELLYSEYPNITTNLYVSSTDIPAIIDVDFDGDIDVLTFHQSGEHVEYHQNQSMELYGIPDSLTFILMNECWGKFSEDLNTNSVLLNDPNAPCVGGDIPNPLREKPDPDPFLMKHSGSTIMAFDYDNSGVLDVLLGDVSFTNLVLLINGGAAPNTNSAMISQDPFFPSNTTGVDLQLFPAAFYVDVDFDGIKDIVVGANAKNVSENETSIRFYKNIGSNSLPNFTYSSPNVFQSEMIEHGSASVPSFFDFDDDGLKDLFVANFYRYIPTADKESTIAYYKNTGDANNPQYMYIDYNFLNLDAASYGLRTMPTFGDIDNDGDEDLFLGRDNGSLVFYENLSTGSGAVFAAPQNDYPDNLGNPISSISYAFPQLFDLNNDGLLDMILGNKNGVIIYYENIGTPTNPSFELKNSLLGNVDVTGVTSPDGYSTPHFLRIGGVTKLFIGSYDGDLVYYDSIDGNLDPTESFHFVAKGYVDINVESYSSFAVEDVDNDGNLDLFVGQDLGGIFHFEANPSSSAGISEKINQMVSVYPNPFSNQVIVSSENEIEYVILYDLNGRITHNQKVMSKKVTLETSELETGIYFAKIGLTNGQLVEKKIVKY